MGRKLKWMGGLILVGVILTLAWLRRPPDDLTFLDQWRPVRETRIGDLGHPGDSAYGTWTVLRFIDPNQGAFRPLYSTGPMLPNLEEEFRKREPKLFEERLVYDADYVDTIKSPDGGFDRYLWVQNSMAPTVPDRYQVWIRQKSWLEGAWLAIRQRLGL